jgi:hypothetical protein
MGDFSAPEVHYNLVGSTRRFGVELETSRCPNHRDLNGQTIWECKRDCSIEGMEFISPILYGDEGLAEIESFCQIAQNKRFAVNSSCGYHVHLDASNESEDSLKAIAYAYRRTYALWCALVPDSRSDNRMCGAPDYDCDEIVAETTFDYFVGRRDRFEFVNWRAYLVHGSIEVRLYQGTLDATEICNWIKIHARFIDVVSRRTFEEIDAMFSGSMEAQYGALTAIIGSDLSAYWFNKSQGYGKLSIAPAAPARRRRTLSALATAAAPPVTTPPRVHVDWVTDERRSIW